MHTHDQAFHITAEVKRHETRRAAECLDQKKIRQRRDLLLKAACSAVESSKAAENRSTRRRARGTEYIASETNAERKKRLRKKAQLKYEIRANETLFETNSRPGKNAEKTAASRLEEDTPERQFCSFQEKERGKTNRLPQVNIAVDGATPLSRDSSKAPPLTPRRSTHIRAMSDVFTEPPSAPRRSTRISGMSGRAPLRTPVIVLPVPQDAPPKSESVPDYPHLECSDGDSDSDPGGSPSNGTDSEIEHLPDGWINDAILYSTELLSLEDFAVWTILHQFCLIPETTLGQQFCSFTHAVVSSPRRSAASIFWTFLRHKKICHLSVHIAIA